MNELRRGRKGWKHKNIWVYLRAGTDSTKRRTETDLFFFGNRIRFATASENTFSENFAESMKINIFK